MCFFFNDTATTEIYTLSLHDALPIWLRPRGHFSWPPRAALDARTGARRGRQSRDQQRARPGHARGRANPLEPRRGQLMRRSEEHTSELQSRQYLVCRLLLEKKKTYIN